MPDLVDASRERSAQELVMSVALLTLISVTNLLVLGQLVRMHGYTRRRYAETLEELDAAEQELAFLRLANEDPRR
jgi:hypothetical protein